VTFAQPWALALVALAAPILYAYLHRKHRMKRSVASAILLRTIKDERPAAQRKRAQLRHRLSLALVLAALVAALFALAGPASTSADGRRIVIVLDRSASMATREGGSDRLTRAAGVVADLANSAGDRDEVALIAAGGEPAIAVAPTTNHADIVAGAKALAARGAGGDGKLDALAFRLADGLCREPARTAVVVVTDGGITVPATKCKVSARSVGGDAENVGISALSARAVDGLGLYDVYVAVASSYGKPKHVEINLSADGALLDVVALDVPANGDADRTLRVTVDHGKTLSAALAGDDALALDDRAEVPLGGAGPVSALLVTAKKHSLIADALRVHPRVTLTTATPDVLPARPFDLIVLESAPAQVLPPSPHVVAFGVGAGEGAPIEIGAVAAQRGVVRWDFDAPWFRFVDLRDVLVVTSHLVAGGRSVVDSASGPLIATAPWPRADAGPGPHPLGPRDGQLRELVMTGFSIDETDLTLRAAFPNLIANFVDWAAPRTTAGAATGVLSAAESHVTAKPVASATTEVAGGDGWDAAWLARIAVLLALALILVEQALYARTRAT
jgi:Ca-activated chloride channel homolog